MTGSERLTTMRAEPLRVVPRRIPLLLVPFAGLAACLFPKRLGPHLAAAPLYVAVLNFVFAWLLARLLVASSLLTQPFGIHSLLALLEMFRSGAIAMLVGIPSRPPPLLITSWFTPVEALLLIGLSLCLLLWPIYSIGESKWFLAQRCLKLTLWSSSFLVWVAFLVPRMDVWIDYPWLNNCEGLLLLWYLVIIQRLGARYCGPRRGYRWEPVELCCDQCGYPGTGLRESAVCPECGDRYDDKRLLPPWDGSSWLLLPLNLLRTIRQASGVRFGNRLAIWQHPCSARSYSLVLSQLSGLAVAATLYTTRYVEELPDALLVGQIVGIGLVLWGWVADWLMFFRHGSGAFGRSVVVHYQAHWWLLAGLVAAGSLLLIRFISPSYDELLMVHAVAVVAGGLVMGLGWVHTLGQMRRAWHARD